MNERSREVQNAHLARVTIMLATGLPVLARYYLAVLHALCMTEIARWRVSRDEHNRGDRIAEQEQLAAGYQRASEGAGFSAPDVAASEAQIEPATIAGFEGRRWYAHQITDHHGVFVTGSPRGMSRMYLELQVLIPDVEGSYLVLARMVPDEGAAALLAGRWAALGEAVLVAETARQAGGSTT